MIYSWLVPPRYYALLGLSLLVIFMFGWLMLSQSAEQSVDNSRSLKWELPQDLQEILMEDIEFLKSKGFFGEGGGASDEFDSENIDKSWRALGVVMSGEDIQLLVKGEAGDVKTLKVGDILPDDYVVEHIDKDGFVIEKEGQEKEIRLFPMTLEEMQPEEDNIVDADEVLEKVEEGVMPPSEKTKPNVPLKKPKARPKNLEGMNFDDLPDLDDSLLDIPLPDKPVKESTPDDLPEIDRSLLDRPSPSTIPDDLLDALEDDDDLF